MTRLRRPGRPLRSLTRVGTWLLAVMAAVGLLVFGAGTASAASLPDAGNHVRASAPETITAVGVSEHVRAGQGRGPPVLQPRFVVATGVAANTEAVLVDGAGSGTRALNLRPNAADPNWGLTRAHLDKHLIGDGPYSLSRIDPGGNPDVWWGHMQELASRPATATLKGGIEDVIGTFPKTGGDGTFQFGIRVSPASDGSWDLVTLLTKQ